jgi:dipeptidyl-peptidase 4
MIKRSISICLAFLIFLASNRAQKVITLDDIWTKGTFAPKGVAGFNFTPDGKHYMVTEGKNIVEYALETGNKTRTLYAGDASSTLPAFDSYTFSPDGSKILLATETESIYRHSSKSQYYLVDRVGGVAKEIMPKAKIMYATFSPDGSKIAYLHDNDLYYYELNTASTVRITTDGKLNEVINGGGDWVYEEEFVLVRAFEWSSDSKSIAWVRFDESPVPEYSMETYDPTMLYPGDVTFKYPKVGEQNSKVSVWIFDAPSANITKVQTSDPEYIARIKWTPDHQLCVTTLNRLQNKLELLLADRATGKSRLLLKEENKYYVDVHDNLTFLEGGKSFLWTSEKGGYNQIYWYRIDGTLREKITKSAWDITEFYGIDEASGTLYFQAAACSPLDREIYKYSLSQKKCMRLSPQRGTNAASFSPGFSFFSLSHSSINAPSQYAIYNNQGKLVRSLEKNEKLTQTIAAYQPVPVQFFDFKGPSGHTLNGFMLTPKTSQTTTAKFPLLMFVYGGPGSQQVVNAWKGNNYWWFQMLVQKGYAVACVDNRGTGARGEDFKKLTYGQLGKYETEDQIAAAKYLGNRGNIDRTRIGIFGWSYGGYMSSRCLFEGNDVFKAAIAVAPVTNWKWYDSVYTERFMGLYADNASGYDQNAPIAFAKDLKGDFLLVHGLADDNVHFQNTAELAKELIKQNKQYQTMIYPNKNHSIAGAKCRLHLYQLMTDFLDQKLLKLERF